MTASQEEAVVGMETVFVTVGSTQFSELTQLITAEDTLKVLGELGCRRLIVQYGKADAPDISGNEDSGITIEAYAYKPSIADDLAIADVVVGHAGAGTIVEALEAGKKMVVVTNDRLMDNHQAELATKMQELHHLAACTCATLVDTLRSLPDREFQPYRQDSSDRAVVRLIAEMLQQKRADQLRAAEGGGRSSILLFLLGAILAFIVAYLIVNA